MARTGGQVNWQTGQVETGRMPNGTVEGVATIKDGPMRIFRRKGRK